MLNEYSRIFLLDAVMKYRNAEDKIMTHINTTSRAGHLRAANYLCAAVEAFLENGDEDFRTILNRACWNGEELPTDESLVKQLKRRARQIEKQRSPQPITLKELDELLKPAGKEWKPLPEDTVKRFEEFVQKMKEERKK